MAAWFWASLSGMTSSFVVASERLVFFFDTVMPHVDERTRRIVVGAMARALGHGGVTAVAGVSGVSLSTVQTGAVEVDAGIEVSDRVRAPGAGRKSVEESQPGMTDALDALVDPQDPWGSGVCVAVDDEVDATVGDGVDG
jgi:hypothetical protein